MKHLKLLIEIAFVLVMFLSTGASASVSNAISSYHKISAVREKALAEISMAQKNLFAFPEKSFSDANRAKMLADNLKDENLQGRSLMLMGISLYRLYRFDEANNYFLKANKMFVKTNNLRGQINILKYQGVIQSDQGLYKKSFPFFDEAINLSKKIKNDTITVDLIILNGYVHVFNSDLNNSFLNFDNAYQIARNSKKLSLIARSSLALGDWYNANGNFKSAIDFYHKAAIICDSLNDRGGYIWAMNKLGMLFAGWQRYSDALDYLRKALSKSDDNHLLSGSGLTQRNLGEVYISKGQYHEALQNYLTAYNLEKISGNRPGMAESLCGEAEVLLNDNQIIRVKNILDSIKILVKGNYDPTIHAAINRISGLYHIKTTNYSQARVDLLNAVKLAKNYDQARLRLSAIHDLKMLCEKEKNYAEAYRYTLQYNALSDSVFNIRIHSQLMEKRMIFRNDEIRQQIESLKSVNREDLATVYSHNQIVWKQRLLMFIGIIGSIIFSVLLILIIKHNRTIKKVNKLLNERNYQLVIQKDQINESIQKAKQSEKLQSAFLANMSHEIRTPMNAIMGFSELLGLDNVEEEESEQFIDHIISNSEILLDIMDNIIDIAR
ncbi:MAG: tetratricopeptide repeat protein, partial [Bacteroidota bacterium]|nr:tetratricopeptide repeat protein [Bacteroidota bacterium]